MNQDFEKYGKQLPYNLPEDFFDNLHEGVAKGIERHRKSQRRKSLLAAVAVVVVSLVSINFFNMEFNIPTQSNNFAADPLYAEHVISNLPDEELDQWVDFYDNDMFFVTQTSTDF